MGSLLLVSLDQQSPPQLVPIRRPASGAVRGSPGAEKDRGDGGRGAGVRPARSRGCEGPVRALIRWTGTGDFGDSLADMKRRLKPLPKTRAEHPWRIRRESDDDVADREDPMLSLGARLAEPAESS